MNRRLACVAIAAGLIVSGLTAQAADPAAKESQANRLEFVLLARQKPVRLAVQIELDGRPVAAIWDKTFASLLNYFDLDRDGFLSRAEASRLPAAFTLRQVLWLPFVPTSGKAPPFARLDRNADGKVSGAELAAHYRSEGLGSVQVGVGQPTATQPLTEALIKQLDKNNDRRLNEAECRAALKALAGLDKNEDELVGPGELIAGIAYPGARGSALLMPTTEHAKPLATLEHVPLLRLPTEKGSTYWLDALAAWRNKHEQPRLADDWFREFAKQDAAVHWLVRAGSRAQGQPTFEDGPQTANRLQYSTGDLIVELRLDVGLLKEQVVAGRKRMLGSFTDRDGNGDGVLDEKELGQASPMKQLLPIADLDGDGRLSRQELTSWLDFQEQVARGHVLLTILDHGSGLFEFLDADHDGGLSQRELRTAWDRLNNGGCVTDGRLDPDKLPRLMLATVSHGHPRTPLGKRALTGADWFQAMDRNGDGDVSRREFSGAATLFDKLDLDKDGLIDAHEALKASAKK